MTDSPRHAPARVPSNAARIAAIAAATLLAIVGLAGPADAQEESGSQDACAPRDADYDPSRCFDYEVVQECGALDVQFTENGTPYTFLFQFAEGENVPDDHNGDGDFPAAWPEDHNDGEIQVTFYAVGPERDYLVGGSIPNWWDRSGTTVTVETDCEDDPRPPPPPLPSSTTTISTTTTEPTTTTIEATTSTEATTTTDADASVGGIGEEVDPVDDSAGIGGAVGGGELPRTGAGTGGLLLVAGAILGLGAVLRAASRRST